jgi:hypothetical protein
MKEVEKHPVSISLFRKAGEIIFTKSNNFLNMSFVRGHTEQTTDIDLE